MATGNEDDDQDEKLLEMLLNDPAPSSNHDEKRRGSCKNATATASDRRISLSREDLELDFDFDFEDNAKAKQSPFLSASSTTKPAPPLIRKPTHDIRQEPKAAKEEVCQAEVTATPDHIHRVSSGGDFSVPGPAGLLGANLKKGTEHVSFQDFLKPPAQQNQGSAFGLQPKADQSRNEPSSSSFALCPTWIRVHNEHSKSSNSGQTPNDGPAVIKVEHVVRRKPDRVEGTMILRLKRIKSTIAASDDKSFAEFEDETGLIGATIDPFLHFKYQGALKVASVWVLRDVTVIKAAVQPTCEPSPLLCVCCRNVQGIH